MLQDLQKKVLSDDTRKKFIDKGQGKHFLYFRLLLLSQLFDEAITHLCSGNIDGFQVETIHFAIALHYYGLLSRMLFF